MVRKTHMLQVIGMAAVAILAALLHQWDRGIAQSLRDPGMRTVTLPGSSAFITVRKEASVPPVEKSDHR